jgi:hypothetical protein
VAGELNTDLISTLRTREGHEIGAVPAEAGVVRAGVETSFIVAFVASVTR